MSSRADRVPHAFPFRLVDRSEPSENGTIAVVLASAGDELTGARPWPVSLVAEALAQAILLTHPPGDRPALVALDRVRLLQPVCAGDRLEVRVEAQASFGALRRFACRATRGGALAAVADVSVSG